ncbi:MAG: 1-acyl-sn-glycerol-3-phosphate acyltransferase [Candidatus Marinimicrobia bacterium]|nr:1-acyl-sn-glycerol-3-phosphate acyltransferase [Candidatus Neomarinimicrobiota bacterium]
MRKRIYIEGKDNYDRSKKYILVANHTSIYDIPAIMSVVPGVSWIGREYLIRIPGFGHLLKMNDYIPIEPGKPGRSWQSIKQAITKAKDGITVAIFPEGTRTVNGQLGTFKKGFIHILRATHLNILPVTLNGFYSLKPKTRFTIVPKGKLEVVIHPSIDNKKLLSMADNEILDVVKKTISSSYQGR